jgi:hypothetical protein
MTEGEQQDIQPTDYKSLAAREIWIKPAGHGRLARVSAGFRWTSEERRLLWITAVGGAIGSLVTLLVVGLAVALDRLGSAAPNNKAALAHQENLLDNVTVVAAVVLLVALAYRGWRRRQPFDRSFRQWQWTLWSLIGALIVLALVGRAAGIH